MRYQRSVSALFVVAIVLSLGSAVWLAAAQERPAPPRDATGSRPRQVTGKGTISGTVSVAGSGQPARRARVNLSGGQDVGGSRGTTTDENGAFVFDALPEGRFNLSASKAGYVSTTYGQRQPGRPGTPIMLGDGQRLQVQLQITRGGVITGTVLDEHAEALPGTPVRALRYVMQSGQRTLQPAGNSSTDDRGVYRIYGLQPGEYLVYATPRNSNTPGPEPRLVELQQLLQQQTEVIARLGAAQAQALNDRIAQLRAAQDFSQSSDEVTSGYAPVYYPGTTTPANAATVTVAPGEEKGNIDFQYQIVPIARVEGIVTSANSQIPPNVQVSLVNSALSVPGISPGSTRADAQGAFRIPNVPPGQYTLVARATLGGAGRENFGGRGPGAAGPGGRGAAGGRGRGPATDQIRLWATADVTVDGRNVSNVVLTLQQGMSVSGRIVFDGTAPPPADTSGIRVTLMPVVQPGTSGDLTAPAAGRVDADGRFTIASVFPGRYRLTSNAGNGWYLGSSMIENQDSLDFPIEIKPGQNVTNAVVTFVDRQSELTGTIVNEKAQPVPEYSLIVYPADQRFWIPQSRRIQSTRPATDGRYTFRNLPAGDYRLVPVYDPEPGSWFDPAFLQQLESAAVRVTIADGETKEQNLRVPGGG
jgi:hypothetical protein